MKVLCSLDAWGGSRDLRYLATFGGGVCEKPLTLFKPHKVQTLRLAANQSIRNAMSNFPTLHPTHSSQDPGPLVIEAAPPYSLVRTRHGLMLANRNDIFLGQALIEYGECCEKEVQFLSQLITRGGVVVKWERISEPTLFRWQNVWLSWVERWLSLNRSRSFSKTCAPT